MKTHSIKGGGNVQLHVMEAGNPNGRPIVFIHGFSQCGIAWERQMNSTLAQRYRLVALDMRGHGLSEKPAGGYDNSKLWAEDVNAVINGLNLDHPVLCGWSYGSLVSLDYVRHYGEERLGGLQFVGGVSKLGSEEALAVLTPEFLSLVPDFFSTDSETSVRGLKNLLRLCFAERISPAEMYLMLGFNLSVPPYVRQALLSRSVNNDDLLPRIRKPVLITHGSADTIVKPAAAAQHKSAMPHAGVQLIGNTGHAPFWDDAAGFNDRLQAFCESLQPASH